MGYYSKLFFSTRKAEVDEKAIKKIENYFNDVNNSDVYGFLGVKLPIVNGRLDDILLDEYQAKFYDDLIFACKLSEAVKSGYIDLKFIGEEGDQWGYRIEKDKVTEINFISIGIPEDKFEEVYDFITNELDKRHIERCKA